MQLAGQVHGCISYVESRRSSVVRPSVSPRAEGCVGDLGREVAGLAPARAGVGVVAHLGRSGAGTSHDGRIRSRPGGVSAGVRAGGHRPGCRHSCPDRLAKELRTRPSLRGPKVVVLDSGSGLANATLQQRLVPVRLFYDFLGEEGVRVQSGRPRPLAVEWFRGINSVLGRGAHRHLWALRRVWVGDQRRRNRELNDRRVPVGMADEVVVTRGARAHGGALSGSGQQPVEPGPLLGGINVDVDEVLATDFGQWDFDR
jgi:hypothetical protein